MTASTERSRGYKKDVLLFDELEVAGFNAIKEFSHANELDAQIYTPGRFEG